MRFSPFVGAALVFWVCALSPARAEITPLVWSDEGVFERNLSLPATQFAEVCGPVQLGQRIEWQFEADAPLDFNIHFHAGQQVTFPERQKQVALAQGVLTVGAAQDHCWMWSHRGTGPATLKLRLKRL